MLGLTSPCLPACLPACLPGPASILFASFPSSFSFRLFSLCHSFTRPPFIAPPALFNSHSLSARDISANSPGRIAIDLLTRICAFAPGAFSLQMQAIMDSLPPALRQDLASVMNRSLFAKARTYRHSDPSALMCISVVLRFGACPLAQY
jgi:hypothetical protein